MTLTGRLESIVPTRIPSGSRLFFWFVETCLFWFPVASSGFAGYGILLVVYKSTGRAYVFGCLELRRL